MGPMSLSTNRDGILRQRYPGPLFQLSENQLATFGRAGSEESHEELILPFVCEPGAKLVDHICCHGPCVVRVEDHPELQEFGKMAREMFGPPQNTRGDE